jgi:hypothetical protein
LYYCKYFSGGLIVSKMFYDNHVFRWVYLQHTIGV